MLEKVLQQELPALPKGRPRTRRTRRTRPGGPEAITKQRSPRTNDAGNAMMLLLPANLRSPSGEAWLQRLVAGRHLK